MGIPLFAKYILGTFRNAGRGPVGGRCNRLFIDFNGSIHEAARSEMLACSAGDNIPVDQFERRVCDSAMDHIVRHAQLFKPDELVYVAVDGLPPRAKMQQQRYRRFAAAFYRKVGSSSISSTSSNTNTSQNLGQQHYQWDTNAITPGTDFMQRLGRHLQESQSVLEQRIGVPVIIDGPMQPGEGEQKIFGYLRANVVATSTDIVYGLDADLILQSLLYCDDAKYASAQGGLWVAREMVDDCVGHKHPSSSAPSSTNPSPSSTISFIDVNSIGHGLRHQFACTPDDFALLCVLIGNDFVPRLPSVSIQSGGITALLAARSRALAEENAADANCCCDNIVNPSTKSIDLCLLTRVVEILSANEDVNMRAAESRYRDACARSASRSALRSTSPNVDVSAAAPPFPDVIQPQHPGWRPRYYYHILHLPAGPDGDADLNRVCASYLQGWVWSYHYTRQTCLSSVWYYPYHAAPTSTDLFHHMVCHPERTTVAIEEALSKLDRVSRLVCEEQAKEYTLPPEILQLLMVLPPQSRHLLPIKQLGSIMTDVDLGCAYMYPESFEFGTYLKHKTWECHPVLPQVSVERIIKAARELIASSDMTSLHDCK
jgi:5'-3' exonuclease